MEFLFSRFSIIRGIKGFRRVYEDALRYRYMITEKALERARILAFWEKLGLDTTLEAFPKTKRRTLFLWKKNFLEGGKKIDALSEKKRTPKTKRKRLWNALILEEIRRIREEHPNLGKDKIFPPLLRFCTERDLTRPTASTIGRLIKDMGGPRRFPKKISHFGRVAQTRRRKVLRKPKHLKAEYPGHIVSLDTVEEYHNGSRRYLITATDIYSRLSFAWATHSHASLAARHFFSFLQRVFPFPFVSVLTDNGSEFAKHFAEEVNRLHLLHYHTYPRTPKMNAHVERFRMSFLIFISLFFSRIFRFLITSFWTIFSGSIPNGCTTLSETNVLRYNSSQVNRMTVILFWTGSAKMGGRIHPRDKILELCILIMQAPY